MIENIGRYPSQAKVNIVNTGEDFLRFAISALVVPEEESADAQDISLNFRLIGNGLIGYHLGWVDNYNTDIYTVLRLNNGSLSMVSTSTGSILEYPLDESWASKINNTNNARFKCYEGGDFTYFTVGRKVKWEPYNEQNPTSIMALEGEKGFSFERPQGLTDSYQPFALESGVAEEATTARFENDIEDYAWIADFNSIENSHVKIFGNAKEGFYLCLRDQSIPNKTAELLWEGSQLYTGAESIELDSKNLYVPRWDMGMYLYSPQGGVIESSIPTARPQLSGLSYAFDGASTAVKFGSVAGDVDRIVIRFRVPVPITIASPEQCLMAFNEANDDTGIFLGSATPNTFERTLRLQGINELDFLHDYTIPANTWHIFELRWESNQYNFYLNGNLLSKISTPSVDSKIQLTDLTFGSLRDNNFFVGDIDAVRIFAADDELLLSLQCGEERGIISYDASGKGNHGEIHAATIDNFHIATSTFCPQNQDGFSVSEEGNYIPAAPNSREQDILGNELTYKGPLTQFFPRKFNSHCLTSDGSLLIEFEDLPAGTTVTSKRGTANATVLGNNVVVSVGTLYDLRLSNGVVLPLAEGTGLSVYDVSENGLHGNLNTLQNDDSIWGARQGDFHYNYDYGFSKVGAAANGDNFQNWLEGSDDTVSVTSAHELMLVATGVDYVNARLPYNWNLVSEYTLTLDVTENTTTLPVTGLKLAPIISYNSDLIIPAGETGRFTKTFITMQELDFDGVSNFIQISLDDNTPAGQYIKISNVLLEETLGGKSVKVPAKLDGSASAESLAITNPTGMFHNGAETRLDFKNCTINATVPKALEDETFTKGYAVLNGNQYVTLAQGLTIADLGAATAHVEFCLDRLYGNQVLFSLGESAYQMYVDSGGIVCINDFSVNLSVDPGKWYAADVVFNDVGKCTYVELSDGQQWSGETYTTPNSGNGNFYLGALHKSGINFNFFQGKIRNFQLEGIGKYPLREDLNNIESDNNHGVASSYISFPLFDLPSSWGPGEVIDEEGTNIFKTEDADRTYNFIYYHLGRNIPEVGILKNQLQSDYSEDPTPKPVTNMILNRNASFVAITWEYDDSDSKYAAEYFEIERKFVDSETWNPLLTLAGDVRYIEDANFEDSGDYHYRIRASIGSKYGVWSNIGQIHMDSNSLGALGTDLVDVFSIYNLSGEPDREVVTCIRSIDSEVRNFKPYEIEGGTLETWSGGGHVNILRFISQTSDRVCDYTLQHPDATDETIRYSGWDKGYGGDYPFLVVNGELVRDPDHNRPAFYASWQALRVDYTGSGYDELWYIQFIDEAWYNASAHGEATLHLAGTIGGYWSGDYSWQLGTTFSTTFLVFKKANYTWDYMTFAGNMLRSMMGKPSLMFNSNTLYLASHTSEPRFYIQTNGVTPTTEFPDGTRVTSLTPAGQSYNWKVYNKYDNSWKFGVNFIKVEVGKFSDITRFKFYNGPMWCDISCVDQLTGLEVINSMFEDVDIRSIPKNVFRNIADKSKVTSATNVFNQCDSRNLPEGLFDGLTAVTNISTMLARMFYCCNIPQGLFDSFVSVTNAGVAMHQFGLYARDYTSGTLPQDMFTTMTELENIDRIFDEAHIAEIPDYLFYNCTKLTTSGVHEAMCRIPKLTRIGANVLNSSLITNLDRTFLNSGYDNAGTDLVIDGDALASLPELQHLSETFEDCKHIRSLPATLFQHNTKLKTAYETFRDTEISSIPVTLFHYQPDMESFSGTFRYTKITSIPADIFQVTTKVTSFSYTFEGCTLLTEIPALLFNNLTGDVTLDATFISCSGITTIDPEFLGNCTTVVSLRALFYGCTSVTNIPTNMFVNQTKVANINMLFRHCTGVTSLNAGIFNGLSTVTDISDGVFSECTSLTTIPADLLAPLTGLLTSNQLFEGCSSLTNIPATLISVIPQLQSARKMFNGCSSITSIDANFLTYNTELTSVAYMFSHTGITTVPDNFFSTLTKCNEYGYCFEACNSLLTVGQNIFPAPADMITTSMNAYRFFADSENLHTFGSTFAGLPLKNADSLFRHCYALSSIPEAMFEDCTYLDTCTHLFDVCRVLPNIPARMFKNAGSADTNGLYLYAAFAYAGITSIAADAFEGAKFDILYRIFDDCDSLTAIPANCFASDARNRRINTQYMLRNCNVLASVGSNLLNDNMSPDGKYLFANCPLLTSVPSDVLGTNVNGRTDGVIEYAFASSPNVDPVPALWTYFPSSNHTATFRDISTDASNYVDIPEDWK